MRRLILEFIGPSDTPGVYNKDAVVFPPGDIDRSPCGTGTSARCAQLVAEGKLRVGESFVHESFYWKSVSLQSSEGDRGGRHTGGDTGSDWKRLYDGNEYLLFRS